MSKQSMRYISIAVTQEDFSLIEHCARADSRKVTDYCRKSLMDSLPYYQADDGRFMVRVPKSGKQLLDEEIQRLMRIT